MFRYLKQANLSTVPYGFPNGGHISLRKVYQFMAPKLGLCLVAWRGQTLPKFLRQSIFDLEAGRDSEIAASFAMRGRRCLMSQTQKR